MSKLLATYREGQDKIYELLNKNPDAVYNFKDGIIFLLLHSEHSKVSWHEKIPFEDYFDDWYNSVKDLIDYSCTSPIISQFGGIYAYELYEFDTIPEMVDYLKSRWETHFISICYFDCIEFKTFVKATDTSSMFRQYRIKVNFHETKQKRRSIKVNDLLSK